MLIGWARNWGATDAEIARTYPADGLLDGPVERLTRAVTVNAPADLTYRWLCQMSVAPYSYDWIDNWGRRSPAQLTPGADHLVLGQEVAVFRLTEIVPGRSFSGPAFPAAERVFGPLAGTYAVEPVSAGRCRLVCRPVLSRRGLVNRLRASFLVVGDLIMMRKQLLTFKKYAERDALALSGDSGCA